MSIVLAILIVAALIAVVLSLMGKCPIGIPVLLAIIVVALIVLGGTGRVSLS